MTEAVASGECLVTSGEKLISIEAINMQRAANHEAGTLRIVEADTSSPLWQRLPRTDAGVEEQRESRWFAYLLLVGFWMFLMVTSGLIYLGATVVGQSVRHAWERDGMSAASVRAEIASRLR